MKSLIIAATGMMAQQLNVEVVSNNIANMRTTGFKRQRAEFQDLVYQNLRQPGSTSATGAVVPSGIQLGLGVKTGAVVRQMSQGNLISTESPLDLAVRGEGFFEVQLPDGRRAFTRAGSFERNAQGRVVTIDGYSLQPEIILPDNVQTITINPQGSVQVRVGTATQPQTVGQITIVRFLNPAGLEALGDSLYAQTASSGSPTSGTPGLTGFGNLLQGFVEHSNVNAVNEISSLITAQRAYEMNAKVISISDEMMAAATSIR